MNAMNQIMLSCFRATYLVEIKELEKLSVIHNVQLRMHLAMCDGCKNYSKQSKLINWLLNRRLTDAIPETDTKELEEKIVSKL